MHIRRLPRAVSDLDAIWLYIAQHDPDVATRVVKQITAKIERLAEHPFTGRERLDLAQDARSAPIQSYVILYRVVSDAIEIVRVVHGRRRLRRLWRGAT